MLLSWPEGEKNILVPLDRALTGVDFIQKGLKKVITKKIKMSGLALVSDTNRVEKLTDESYATLRRLEYSRGDLTIYINIDYRVEDGQIIGASGMISRGGIGSAVNLYEITKPMGNKSIELGINWFASGTQDVEITKDFIEKYR